MLCLLAIPSSFGKGDDGLHRVREYYYVNGKKMDERDFFFLCHEQVYK